MLVPVEPTCLRNPGQSIPLTLDIRLFSYACVAFTEFISPAAVRSAIRREQGDKYGNRKDAEEERITRKEARKLEEDELAVSKVFA